MSAVLSHLMKSRKEQRLQPPAPRLRESMSMPNPREKNVREEKTDATEEIKKAEEMTIADAIQDATGGILTLRERHLSGKFPRQNTSRLYRNRTASFFPRQRKKSLP